VSIGTSLAPSLDHLSNAMGRRSIAAAESCTAGLLMAALADIADASERFKGGVVAYSTDDKADVLGVGPDVIARHGTVSAECAEAMASRVREMFDTDVGLAVTGVAGPATQEGKPVGLTYVAVAGDHGTAVREHRFNGGRAANRVAAVEAVLQLAAESMRIA
jgi:nicotinamide-nucleotide amidase